MPIDPLGVISCFAPFQPQLHGAKQLITPSGSIGIPSLSSVIPALGERVESILQVIPTTPLATAASEYLREVTRTHAAAAVADGAAKPYSTYELEEINSPAQVIAHMNGPHPKRWFDDSASLRRYVDVIMRQGLTLAVEAEILTGSGIAPHLEGMLTVIGHQFQTWTTDILATCRMAITLIELINLPTDGLCFVFHPLDWETMELFETTLSGEYKMNDADRRAPVNRQARLLWGVQVALSTGLTQGTGVLFHRGAVELKERQGVTMDWSENVYDTNLSKSDFEANQIRFRAEGRWALNIYNPAAIVEIDLEAGT